MTSRERLMKAVRFEATDRIPHFEQTFELSEEAFGLSMPTEAEMARATPKERERLFARCAEVYARIAGTYRWDAVLVWNPVMDHTLLYEFIPFLKQYLGPDLPVGSFVWWAVLCIDTVRDYTQFAVDLYESPEKLHGWAEKLAKAAIEHANRLGEAGCDLVDVGSDMAYNAGPFISPAHFSEFVTPYLKRVIAAAKQQVPLVILHSDGNLMPVLDQILETAPHALQSIDPMAGMDIAEVKRRTFGKMALMGNVQCDRLQTGPDEAIVRSAEYCLTHGAPGGGYIFSSSNTIFKGVPLRNYERMLEVLQRHAAGAGLTPDPGCAMSLPRGEEDGAATNRRERK
jgi:uroporphyrinogen decarboxylase